MKKLNKETRWYNLTLYFSDRERGPKYFLSNHIITLIKEFRIASYTILEDRQHFDLLGTPAVERLFGGYKGSRPVIMQILISDQQLEYFLPELKEVAKSGEANLFYQTSELNLILGNPEALNKLDESQVNGYKAV